MDTNIYFNGIIVDPAAVLRPTIRIAPLINQYLINKSGGTEKATSYLLNRFGKFLLCIKGKQAITVALSYYNLKPDDVVTILTTSGNYYISGCVTRMIEKYCKWNRQVCDKTKVIFFNHEFGYPNREMESVAKYGIPIIEDCAHSFFDEDPQIGKYSDFVIYSLPKAFPMQVGAVIKTNKDILYSVSEEMRGYILRNLSQHIDEIEKIRETRVANYNYYIKALSDIGISDYFCDEKAVPGVFLFRWKRDINYQGLKDFLWSNGVECSVFYGEPAFYLPCHQNLTAEEKQYIVELIHYWYKFDIEKA